MKQESVIQIHDPRYQTQVRKNIAEVLTSFEKLDPELFNLFQLTIEKIFYAGSMVAGGGSSSGALGCIWLNPRAYWKEQDYLEFFVHELTHNLLFLDERRETHYPFYSELEKSENFALSAILKRGRPLDKVIHSLFVVYEVLSFRIRHFNPAAKTFLHPDTVMLFQGAEDTLQSLRKVKPQLLSEHLKNMILELEKNLKPLKVKCYENQKFTNL